MKIDFLRKLVETHERIEKALKRVQDLRLRKEYGRLLGLLEFIIELLFSPNFLEMELDCELSKLRIGIEDLIQPQIMLQS